MAMSSGFLKLRYLEKLDLNLVKIVTQMKMKMFYLMNIRQDLTKPRLELTLLATQVNNWMTINLSSLKASSKKTEN